MKIHAVASLPHYLRHLDAVWKHLPADLKGSQIVGPRAHAQGLPPADVVMVASYVDLSVAGHRRAVYVEHGAGQRYEGVTWPLAAKHYSGGDHSAHNVIGYVCPSAHVAARWGAPTFVAGCPALDSVRRATPGMHLVVGMTFHWDAHRVCPEARSARDHYIDDLAMVKAWVEDNGCRLLGHAHPRDAFGPTVWRNLGVPYEPDPDAFLSRIGLLLADNSSIQFEAALLGIPNVVLNAPWYRRHIEHGLRFWEFVPGPQVDDAYELCSEQPQSWINDILGRALGSAARRHAYGDVTGGGRAAARWIADLVG